VRLVSDKKHYESSFVPGGELPTSTNRRLGAIGELASALVFLPRYMVEELLEMCEGAKYSSITVSATDLGSQGLLVSCTPTVLPSEPVGIYLVWQNWRYLDQHGYLHGDTLSKDSLHLQVGVLEIVAVPVHCDFVRIGAGDSRVLDVKHLDAKCSTMYVTQHTIDMADALIFVDHPGDTHGADPVDVVASDHARIHVRSYVRLARAEDQRAQPFGLYRSRPDEPSGVTVPIELTSSPAWWTRTHEVEPLVNACMEMIPLPT
jgi:hypothetical protein